MPAVLVPPVVPVPVPDCLPPFVAGFPVIAEGMTTPAFPKAFARVSLKFSSVKLSPEDISFLVQIFVASRLNLIAAYRSLSQLITMRRTIR